MKSEEIRQAFLDYFEERGHLRFPSMSLVPSDPAITTLFTIAGMQQMIPYFLGREDPPSRRIVNVQKGIRTVDIDEVGDDSHLTFLEMLGNFSIGDYFKRESIAFTWEFLTQRLKVPVDRWWATVYPGDGEARQAWIDTGMAPDRIGETSENWWDQGPVGPCGPDSEIFYDRGVEHGCGDPNCRPENECCERFLEIWNNVFMTFFQEETGVRRKLPWNNIDTGMGLERLTMVVQGVESLYDSDLFQPIIRSATELAGVGYRTDAATDRSLRIISDHSRAVTFMIADGVIPASESRGYVLRRLIRRAVLRGRMMGIDRPFLAKPVEAVIDNLAGYWTELDQRRSRIIQVVAQEEARFLLTLSRGLSIFEQLATEAERAGLGISGRDAFTLYDTHGFPLEITMELASERKLSVDRDAFDDALREQRRRGKEGRRYVAGGTSPESYAAIAEDNEPTVFRGYDELRTATEIVALVADGHPIPRAEAGDEIEIILAATPFYAESGGQVGDAGAVRADAGIAEVLDTQRPIASLIVHNARVQAGVLSVGDAVEAEVDTERRLHILPHHSGTHLLHKALQEVLGPEATQAGSLVAPDRLRFDFRWPRPVTEEELRDVQDRVNAAIWANLPVRRDTMPYEDAIGLGAMALFGEKYGDLVRVVSIGDWSKELCGGTHVAMSGDIGLLVITSETGIGNGIRRIEALAGAAAYMHLVAMRDCIHDVAEALETRPESVLDRVKQVTVELRDTEKRASALTRRVARMEADLLVREGIAVNGFTVVAHVIEADSKDYLKAATDAVKAQIDRGIVVLATVVEGRPAFTMAVTSNLRDRGFNANTILREAVRPTGGGAGGRPDFAEGGGGDASDVQAVLQTALDIIKRRAGE
ncbi:MAG: alanine--tRNA ligase [Chloroflexota bacterium]